MTPQRELTAQAGSPHAFACQWVQTWRDLLFVHWDVPIRAVQQHLPAGIEPDTFDGQAWISAVAFHLTTRPPGLPPIPFCSRLLELNLRTYVRSGGDPAVVFLSMHGGRRLAVWLGQRLTPLPYAFARIRYDRHGSRRHFRCAAGGRPLFAADYEGVGAEAQPAADSLDAWLLERYAAIVPARDGGIARMTVRHSPWRVRSVDGRVAAAGLGQPWGFALDRPPVAAHFAMGVTASVGRFEYEE